VFNWPHLIWNDPKPLKLDHIISDGSQLNAELFNIAVLAIVCVTTVFMCEQMIAVVTRKLNSKYF
jgi:hypothetical protein